MKKLSQILKEKFSSSKNNNPNRMPVPVKSEHVNQSEFEIITDNVIYDTIGPNGSMTAKLDEILKSYEADSNPIGADVTKKIIEALIADAVCQRSKIAERFISAVNEGEITTKYYDKIKAIQNQEAKVSIAVSDASFISAEAAKMRERYSAISKDEFEKQEYKLKRKHNENQ